MNKKQLIVAWVIGLLLICGCSDRKDISSTTTLEKSSSQIFEDVSPAVVLIRTSSIGGLPATTGSGFIIRENGVIVTCLHVVSGVQDIKVEIKDGKIFPVVGIIAFDVRNDLCLLKIDGENLATVELGDMDEVVPGSKVFTIGIPSNLEYTISSGFFSEYRRLFSRIMIQFTASISPGISGGPVIDVYGNAIGIATFVRPEGGGQYFGSPINRELKGFIQDSINKTSEHEMKVLLGNFKEAKEYLSQALEYTEQWKSTMDSALTEEEPMEVVHEGIGNRDICRQAIEYYKKALNSGVNSPYVYERVANLYCFCFGDYDKGFYYFKKAIEISPEGRIVENYAYANEMKILALIYDEEYGEAKRDFNRYSQEFKEIADYNSDAIAIHKAQSVLPLIDWDKSSDTEISWVFRKDLEITGIMGDEKEPYAIVNQEVVKVGDKIGEIEVLEIGRDTLTFIERGITFLQGLTGRRGNEPSSSDYRKLPEASVNNDCQVYKELCYEGGYVAGTEDKENGYAYIPTDYYNLPLLQLKLGLIKDGIEEQGKINRGEFDRCCEAGFPEGYKDGYYDYPKEKTMYSK